jgi:tetratricopeptide (TPR) repeat protein
VSPEGKAALDDAVKSYHAEQYQAAIDTYKNLIAKNIDTVYAYAGLARVYLRQGKTAEAYAAAQSAVTAEPNTVPAQVALGEVYFRQGRITDAERAFVSACGLDAHAYLGLARLYEITANYLRANSALASARKLDLDDPDVRWAWMYGSGNDARRVPRQSQAAPEHHAEGSGTAAGARPASGSGTISGSSTPSGSSATSGGGATSGGSATTTPVAAPVAATAPSAADEHACRVVSKAPGTQVALDPIVREGAADSSNGAAGRAAAYTLATKLDGSQVHLVVDTGASGIVISRKAADRLGIKPIARQEIEGLGDTGASDSYAGLVNSLKIGDVELQGCYVRVADRASLFSGSDGLIGTVIFEDFLVDLNFPDAKFKLSQLPPLPASAGAQDGSASIEKNGHPQHDRYIAPEMANYTPVYRIGSDLAVLTSINSSPPKLFLLDTGSFDDLITPSAAREVTHVSTDTGMTVKGMSGTVKTVATADRLTIQFGRLKQDRSDTVTMDLTPISSGLETEVSGMLGFGMLRMIDIKIDYRDALVDFSYNANRLH